VNAWIPQRLRPAVNGDASPLRSGGIDQAVRIGANEFAQPFDRVLDPLRGGIQNRFAFVSVVGERFDDFVLALEIPVDRAMAHARAPDDVGHPRLMKTIL
jgi:hypothetical protein